MDITTAVGAVLAAFGLSGAAGLNAWLPLFVSALLARFDVVELAGSFDELSTTPGLVVLGALTVADFVGDKIPVVDHGLHLLGSVIAPVSGALLFTGPTDEQTSLPTIVSLVLGAIVAGSVHAVRATLRPAATATTGGLGNPVVSLGEDASSGVLTALAFIAPIVAVLLLIALLVGAIVAWRRVRRVLRR
ncbi:MAG TPA: DUF4126 domain-containing protein [Gaiellaceae bacterium]|nr:DUF4126 domain-containing protein [Gaiellaceae bacterium]